jgi:hypothetical protein
MALLNMPEVDGKIQGWKSPMTMGPFSLGKKPMGFPLKCQILHEFSWILSFSLAEDMISLCTCQQNVVKTA